MNINLSLLPDHVRFRICAEINKQLKLAALEHQNKFLNCDTLEEDVNLRYENKQLIDFINHYEQELDAERKKSYPKCK